VPPLLLAASQIEPMDLLGLRSSGVFLSGLRLRVEHLRNERTLPDMRPPMDMDGVPALHRMVSARRLVRTLVHIRLSMPQRRPHPRDFGRGRYICGVERHIETPRRDPPLQHLLRYPGDP
jgi:hypothetical protein